MAVGSAIFFNFAPSVVTPQPNTKVLYIALEFMVDDAPRHSWDIETVPDIQGFAAANGLDGKSDDVR